MNFLAFMKNPDHSGAAGSTGLTATELSSQLFPAAKKCLLKSEEAEVRIEEIPIQDFAYIILHVNTFADLEIQYTLPAPGIIVNYVLEASVPSWAEAFDQSLQMPDTYTVYFFEATHVGWIFPKGHHLMVQLFIRPDDIHQLSLYFQSLSAFSHDSDNTTPDSFLPATFLIPQEIKECLQQIIACELTGDLALKYFDIKTAQLLFDLNKQMKHPAFVKHKGMSNSDGELLFQIILYIKNNLETPINFNTILKSFHLSEYRAKKLFREGGFTFSSFLLESRMKAAMDQLGNTKKKIAAVAKEVGYSNASKFSHAFNKHFGMFPSAYRKKSAEEDTTSPEQDEKPPEEDKEL